METPFPAETRVLLGDGRTLFRAGLLRLLVDQPGLNLVGEAGTTDGLLRFTEATAFDVVAIERNLPGGAVEVARTICGRFPSCHVLLYGLRENDPALLPAVRAGVTGFMDVSADLDQLVAAIRQVASGGMAASPALVLGMTQGRRSVDAGPYAPEHLTQRELGVLRLVATGRSNRDIAQSLGISEHTVRGHLRSVSHKLGVRNRVQAVSEAVRNGLLESEQAS